MNMQNKMILWWILSLVVPRTPRTQLSQMWCWRRMENRYNLRDRSHSEGHVECKSASLTVTLPKCFFLVTIVARYERFSASCATCFTTCILEWRTLTMFSLQKKGQNKSMTKCDFITHWQEKHIMANRRRYFWPGEHTRSKQVWGTKDARFEPHSFTS